MSVDIAALRALLAKTPRETVFVSVTTVVLGALLDQLEAAAKARDAAIKVAVGREEVPSYSELSEEYRRCEMDLEASRAREARYREALRKIASDDAEGGGCLYCTAPMDDVGKHDSWCPVQIARTALNEAAK